MDQEIIKKIYDMIINDIELSYQNLLTEGITDEDIELLLLKKIIKQTKEGSYELYIIDKFHQYGIKLLVTGRKKEANACFRKCYQMTPNGRKINLQMMLLAVINENYEEAYKIYKNIESKDSEKHKLDNNLFLYLLNLIKSKPEYAEKVRDFNYDDLVFSVSKHNKDENLVRKAIYQNKFVYACNLINDVLSKRICEYSVKYELIKALLSKVIDAERKYKKHLLYLAKNEQYNTIIEVLIERANTKPLSKLENYILLIAGSITKMLQTKIVPEKTIDISYDMYKALIGNNFALALAINEDHLAITEINKEDDIVNVLLVKINQLINQLEKTTEKEEPRKEELEEHSVFSEELKPLTGLEKDIKEAEDLAYYIKETKMQLEEAIKKLGIMEE